MGKDKGKNLEVARREDTMKKYPEKLGELTIEQLNSYQKEVKALHEKYGVGMAELHMTLHKGTYSISEPIELINETIISGV